MTYGLPCMGSKSRIAKKIIDFLPKAKNLYDLFMGGGAIADCAAKSGKWENVIANDVDPLKTRLYQKAMNGEYANETRWISREDFFRLKDTDEYVAAVWSFGNDTRNYIYGRNNEAHKKALHYAIYFDDYSLLNAEGNFPPPLTSNDYYERYQELKKWFRSAGYSREHRESRHIESEARVQSIERSAKLRNVAKIDIRTGDYRDVEIAKDSVIYCDIPYRGRREYNYTIDYDEFYNWCLNQNEPVYVSSLEMPENMFRCVWECEHAYTLGTRNNCKCVEKIFMPMKNGG